MRARHAICVGQDAAACAVVERTLAAAGLATTHVAALPAELPEVALVVVDRAARQAAGEALCASPVPVIIVGDDLDDDGLIALMRDAPVSHLVGDPRDPDLGVTSGKLVSGDVFGLEKYVAPGAVVHTREVRTAAARRHARAEVCAWAETVGARQAVLPRIASVVDELLMNALAVAPADAAPPMLRWAADPRRLAVSVTDPGGALRQPALIAHVRRARDARGRPNPARPEGGGGAGLGLYLVLANVASLVVNVAPGRQTEIVCTFELARGTRPSVPRVRSLHVFASA